jgi:CcmD family protein
MQTTAPTEKLTVEDRRAEFVPVTGSRESTSAEALLVAAYAIMWALVFAFIWLTARRQRGLSERLTRLEAALETRAAQPPAQES